MIHFSFVVVYVNALEWNQMRFRMQISCSLSVHPSICVSICVQNTSFCQSAGAGIISHLVTTLVFTIFSSTGHRPASLCHGLLSVMRQSVRALTFSLNIFFSETTYRILMKFHRNVPAMVLLRISWKNLILSKTGCHGNKTKKILKTLKIFLSETIRIRATKFGM